MSSCGFCSSGNNTPCQPEGGAAPSLATTPFLNMPLRNIGNAAWINSTIDLDGNPRVVGTAIDLGAYERQ